MAETSNIINQDWRRAFAAFEASAEGIDVEAMSSETRASLSVPCCECGQPRIFFANVHKSDDDPPVYTLVDNTDGPCSDCRQRLEREQELSDLRQRIQAVFPPHLIVNDVSRLPAKPMAAVMAWQPTKDQPGLLLHGPTGLCKTRLSIIKASKMAEEMRTVPCFLKAREFTHDVGQRFSSDYRPDGESFPSSYRNAPGPRWMKGLCQESLLVLDDICKGKLTNRVETELFGLLDERFTHGRATIISSNLSGDGLLKMFSEDIGAPLVRRLREYCVAVGFKAGGAK